MPSRQGQGQENVSYQIAQGLEKTASIKAWTHTTVPSGWLECLGQVVNRADYPGLFGIISTTYNTGGETGLQFRLPNGQGRTIMGVGSYTDPVSGPLVRTLNQQIGAAAHLLASNEGPNHSHTLFANAQVNSPGLTSATQSVAKAADVPNGSGGNADFNYSFTQTATAPTVGQSSVSPGGLQVAHNNMQPSLGMKWIIKT